jgi:hypothetical protein|tara:strand:- start:1164 stop:1442 length:279 start_codon:yes stop_codon:yes gene_type:complete
MSIESNWSIVMISFSKKIFFILVRAYQILFSPLIGQNCRFSPTCSNYAIQAVNSFGILKGMQLAITRILRCHPWGGFGYDPVKQSNPKRARK